MNFTVGLIRIDLLKPNLKPQGSFTQRRCIADKAIVDVVVTLALEGSMGGAILDVLRL